MASATSWLGSRWTSWASFADRDRGTTRSGSGSRSSSGPRTDDRYSEVIVLLTRGADPRAVRTSLVKTSGVTRRRGAAANRPDPVVDATACGDDACTASGCDPKPCRALGLLAGGRREPSPRVRRTDDPGAVQPRATSGRHLIPQRAGRGEESGSRKQLHDSSPVHPTGQKSKKCPQVEGHVLHLSARHAKLRRNGYRRDVGW
jgi:hypothetical protein